MPGHAVASDYTALVDGGHARVIAANRSESVLDARPRTLFSLQEHNEALEQLAKRAGPATEAIVQRVEESFVHYRAELNESAGGQASARVMLLAHNAQRAQLAVELQTSISTDRHGTYVTLGGDKGQTEKGLRGLVGICAFATDLLNKAHEAAREEGKASRDSPTEQLLTRLGVGAPAPVPVATPGVGFVGAATPETAPPPKEPE